MNRNAEAEEIQRVAQSLTRLAAQMNAIVVTPTDEVETISPAKLLQRAEKLYRLRRQRAKFFDESLFGEPAWDLLLDLFIHGERGTPVSVSSACLGAAVPTTTALRWIGALMNKGILCRITDGADGRRSMLKLTEEGRQLMLGFLKLAF